MSKVQKIVSPPKPIPPKNRIIKDSLPLNAILKVLCFALAVLTVLTYVFLKQ